MKNDRIDALLIDRVYANYYLQSEGILNDYNVFSAGFESESFAVGVRPADKTLLQALNQAFISRTRRKIWKYQEWFGSCPKKIQNQKRWFGVLRCGRYQRISYDKVAN